MFGPHLDNTESCTSEAIARFVAAHELAATGFEPVTKDVVRKPVAELFWLILMLHIEPRDEGKRARVELRETRTSIIMVPLPADREMRPARPVVAAPEPEIRV